MNSKRILPLILIVMALLQACTIHSGYVFNSKKLKSRHPGYDLQEEMHYHLKINLPEKPVDREIIMPGPEQYIWYFSDSTIIYIDNRVNIPGYINTPTDSSFSGAIYNNIVGRWLMRHIFYDGWGKDEEEDKELYQIFKNTYLIKEGPPSPSMLMRGTNKGHQRLEYISYPDKIRCGYICGNRLDTTELKKALSSIRIMEHWNVDNIDGRPLKERPITMEALNSGGIEVTFDLPGSK